MCHGKGTTLAGARGKLVTLQSESRGRGTLLIQSRTPADGMVSSTFREDLLTSINQVKKNPSQA